MSLRGYNATQISRCIGVPRRTVHDWVHLRTPRRGAASNRCASCGHAVHGFADLPVGYTYLLGVYLGDGCITALPRGVFKLRVSLDAQYPGIVAEVARAIHSVMPRNAVGRVDYGTWVELTSHSKSWPCLFPQHGPGKKHQRPILLEDWQVTLVERWPEMLVRGLIHSDGCRFQSTGRANWSHPRYVFTNFSADIRQIFEDACGLLGLHTTRARPKSVYISRKADVARMDEFIGPRA